MPITTALTVAVLEYTIKYLFVESSTIPVRSNTPLAAKVASYSMISPLLVAFPTGSKEPAAVALTATLTVQELAGSLLHRDSETTENVVDGHIYACVYVVAARAAAPNLPDAMILFLRSIYVKK